MEIALFLCCMVLVAVNGFITGYEYSRREIAISHDNWEIEPWVNREEA